MELRQLRYFVAIAEERSFTLAAERLWVGQPGLSTQIRRLEGELGLQLFIRHARGVDLTGAGELFLKRARAALTAADAASATGHDLEAGVAGNIRLGLSTDARWQRTSGLLAQFARERPGIQLTILEGYSGTLWRDLRDGRLDAVISPGGLGSPDLLSFALGSEPWVVLVGARHRLVGSGPFHGCDLDEKNIAVTGHRDGAAYDRAVADTLASLGVEATLVPSLAGPTLQATVAAGDVLALTTAPELLHRDVTVRPLAPRRTLDIQLLSRDETPSPALRAFVELAVERLPAATPIAATQLVAAA